MPIVNRTTLISDYLASVGPADYNPEKALNLEHKPYYSFGNRKPLDKPRDTPGNGVWINPALILRL